MSLRSALARERVRWAGRVGLWPAVRRLAGRLGVAAVLCGRRIPACNEGVEYRNADGLEVPQVAGDHGQSVRQGRCGD